MMSHSGTFIVIDGGDGSGKATQTEMLKKRLREDGETVYTIDFPQYEDNLCGELIGECLSGEYGNFLELHPKIASVLYAVDRYESSEKIHNWLNNGAVVISDRYASANQIHQGGKFDNDTKREEFVTWIERLEYEIFDIPRPDGIIYLDVPVKHALELLEMNAEEMLKKKKYLTEGKDVVEDSLEYLQNSRNAALKLVKAHNDWYHVDCIDGGAMMSKQTIHEKVLSSAQYIISD